MARRSTPLSCLLLVVFLGVASLVVGDDSDSSDSGQIVGFRVRISRWSLGISPQRSFQQLSAPSELADELSPVEKEPSRLAAPRFTRIGLAAVALRTSSVEEEQSEQNPSIREFAPILRRGNAPENQPIAVVEDSWLPVVAEDSAHGGYLKRKGNGHGKSQREHGHGERGGGGKWQRRLTACRADVQQFCGRRSDEWMFSDSVKQEIVLCLSENQAQLSPQCSAELSSCATFQCAADAVNICSDVLRDAERSRDSWHEKKHRISRCLESYPSRLTEKCRNALNDRRARHGQPPLVVKDEYTYEDSEDSGYYPSRPSRHPSPHSARSTPVYDSGDSQSVSGPAHSNALPQWALIALVGISAAFVFMAALTLVLLVQHKRRRQRAAVMEAANSLSLPPPPTDVLSSETIRLTQFEMPYHRMDEVQLV